MQWGDERDVESLWMMRSERAHSVDRGDAEIFIVQLEEEGIWYNFLWPGYHLSVPPQNLAAHLLVTDVCILKLH